MTDAESREFEAALHQPLETPSGKTRTWDDYCQWAGHRFESGIYDADVLANEARLVLWELVEDGYEPESVEFRKLAKSIVPHRLTDFVRKTKRKKRDSRRTVQVPFGIPRTSHGRSSTGDDQLQKDAQDEMSALPGWDFTAHGSPSDRLEYEESMALLDEMLDDPLERKVFCFLTEKPEELQEAIEANGYSRSLRKGRPGRRVMAEALGCSVSEYRRASKSVQRKVLRAFGREEA